MVDGMPGERPQNGPDGRDGVGDLRGGVFEWHTEPLLVDPLDLRSEAQDEPAVRELRQISGGHGRNGRAPGEGQGDVRADLHP